MDTTIPFGFEGEQMIWPVIVFLLGLLYLVWRVERIEGLIANLLSGKEAETEEARKQPKPSVALPFFPEEWTDAPWSWKSRWEERNDLENPNPLRNPDDFIRAEIVTRLRSLSEPIDRLSFLTALRRRWAWFDEKTTAAVLRDESPLVRAWGAANLGTEFRDYRNYKFGEGEPPLIVDFLDEVKNDSESIVVASLWKNPQFRGLPWSFFKVKDSWKELIKGMSQLERLALMHNGSLASQFIVALMNADSSELGMARTDHAQLLFSAASNPRIVVHSRHHGRDYWVCENDPNSPMEEYGQMWEACLERWMDQGHVVFAYLNYVQTTPQVKLRVYQRLLSTPESKYLREAVIKGCDAFTDKDVLKLAWDDPEDDCKKAARVVVGNLQDFVGVK